MKYKNKREKESTSPVLKTHVHSYVYHSTIHNSQSTIHELHYGYYMPQIKSTQHAPLQSLSLRLARCYRITT